MLAYIPNAMVHGMARHLKIPIKYDGSYYLYENKQKEIHEEYFFKGDKAATYAELLKVSMDREKRRKSKHS